MSSSSLKYSFVITYNCVDLFPLTNNGVLSATQHTPAIRMGGNCDSNGACAEVNDQMRGYNACAVSWLVTGQLEEEDYN